MKKFYLFQLLRPIMKKHVIFNSIVESVFEGKIKKKKKVFKRNKAVKTHRWRCYPTANRIQCCIEGCAYWLAFTYFMLNRMN